MEEEESVKIKIKYRMNMTIIENFIEPLWFNTFTQPAYELVYQGNNWWNFSGWGLSLTTFAVTLLLIQILVYCLANMIITFLLGLLCGIGYSHIVCFLIHALLGYNTGKYGFVLLLMLWVINKLFKLFAKPKERDIWMEMNNSYPVRSYTMPT